MPTVLIIPEDVESSDGRIYEAGVLTWRENVPLQFTDATTVGHDGAVFAGNVVNMRRQTVDGETWIVGEIEYDSDEVAREAQRLSVENKIAGVSADVAVVYEESDMLDSLGFPVFTLKSAEIVGVTQVPMPAFAGARILSEMETADLLPVLVAALAAGVEPDWFGTPLLTSPTPLTVTSDGRVYGHLALWGSCHIGFDDVCVSPPTGTDYSYFHTGAVRIGDDEIPVGHITMNTGHAVLSADQRTAASHYDHTGTCVADVRAGEDEYGIWIAGAARPDADLDALRSASLSGDWRRVGGQLELVAALAVNVPGFPIPRTATSVAASGQLALVASGLLPNAPKTELELMTASVDRLVDRIDMLLSIVVDQTVQSGTTAVIDEATELVEASSGHLAAVVASAGAKTV